MSSSVLAPSIRFKGFTDPWEQRKVSDIATIVGGGTPDTNNSAYWGGDIDWYAPAEMEGLIYACNSQRKITKEGLKNSSASMLPPNRTILFTSRAGIGKSAILTKESCTNQGFQSLVLNDGFDTYFIYSMTSQLKSKAESIASGSTFLEISGRMLGSIDIRVPKEGEQLRIGKLFAAMDSLITLHQRKLEKVKCLKKALLQKMFPEKGEGKPQIRFKGFADPWEQRKVSDIATIVGGGTPDTNNSAYWGGDIDWYAPAEMEGLIYACNSQRKITKEGLKNSSASMLPPNRTILFTSRAGIGKSAILTKESCTNQGFQSLVLNDGFDTYFIYSMTSQLKSKAESIASGSTFLEISGRMLGSIDIRVPKEGEQLRIGKLFAAMDSLITLHQRKLEKLKNIKKSLLEKMFVA